MAARKGGSSTRINGGCAVGFYLDVTLNTFTVSTTGTEPPNVVHEPFSLGLFLQNLQYQVAGASGALNNPTLPNYLGHPMALILEFAGTTAPDEELTPEDKRMLRKVMPIQLTKVNFGNSNGISTYECEAVALNDLAFADQYLPLWCNFVRPTVSRMRQIRLGKILNFISTQKLSRATIKTI